MRFTGVPETNGVRPQRIQRPGPSKGARRGSISGRLADLAGQLSKTVAVRLTTTVATSGVQLVYLRAIPWAMTPGRYPLRRPQPVVPGRIIPPLRIAEVRRAASEDVGGHRCPGGVGEIGGGFHKDDHLAPQSRAVGRPPNKGPQPMVPGR